MGEARLDAVGGVVGQAQADGAGRRDRAVVGEARALLGQRLDQLGRVLGDLLHVTRILGVQHATGNLVADLVTVLGHLRTLAQHFGGDFEGLAQQRCRPLLLGQLQRLLPADQRHLAGDFLGKHAGFRAAIAQLEQCQGRAETEEAHTMAALAFDLVALLLQRQAVDLDDVIEHAGEDTHHLAVLVPVEARVRTERVDDEVGQVDRAQ